MADINSISNVLALKYRPKNFGELIGQESVSQTLRYSLQNNKLGNAYLFSGLRGSGKTSSARIFAKTLLCDKMPIADPCDICDNCQMYNRGNHIDIIEMDGASNRGIDDIRELINQAQYKPSFGKYKIFIIDEVHMLTKEAFNALLKTLEEPPSHIKFILATTDPLKLPPTILSRTQHFSFKRINNNLVLTHLQSILQKENITYEIEALKKIIRVGEGSLRDTLTTLQQAISFGGNFIKLDSVIEMLGLVDPYILENLIENILKQDREKVLELSKNLLEYDTERIIDELIDFIKLKMFNKSLDLNSIEKFFVALNSGKMLLSSGADGEFALTLTLLKMMSNHENVVYIEKEKELTKSESVQQISKTQIVENKPEQEISEELSPNDIFWQKVLPTIIDSNPNDKISDEALEICIKSHISELNVIDANNISIHICFEPEHLHSKCQKIIKQRLSLIEGEITSAFKNNNIKHKINYKLCNKELEKTEPIIEKQSPDQENDNQQSDIQILFNMMQQVFPNHKRIE